MVDGGTVVGPLVVVLILILGIVLSVLIPVCLWRAGHCNHWLPEKYKRRSRNRTLSDSTQPGALIFNIATQ